MSKISRAASHRGSPAPGPASRDGFPAAVVALRPGPPAKSRLASVGDALRHELAWAMAVDTLTALTAAVDDVLVVGAVRAADLTRWGLDVQVIADPEEPGLNAALAHGAETLVARGATTVLACVGDLPALSPASVREVLAAARPFDRAFLADRSEVGTTMLIANAVALRPRFGGRSAQAHQDSGAHRLAPDDLPVPRARTDVDTEDDLVAAFRIGIGPATAAALARSERFRTISN